jgi:hypothetical protein
MYIIGIIFLVYLDGTLNNTQIFLMRHLGPTREASHTPYTHHTKRSLTPYINAFGLGHSLSKHLRWVLAYFGDSLLLGALLYFHDLPMFKLITKFPLHSLATPRAGGHIPKSWVHKMKQNEASIHTRYFI